MQTEYMTVDPNDLIIDIPVDDAHVQELMDSLARNGMTEPVTVWLQGMRIINGFHRTAAAIRLGWAEMPCLVKDLNENAFWDARIIAAKPHKAIEGKRVAAWMLESWRVNFDGKKVNIDSIRDMAAKYGVSVDDSQFGNEQLQIMAILDALNYDFSPDRDVVIGWEKKVIGKTPKGYNRTANVPIFEKRAPTTVEAWFEDKATRWGCDVSEIGKNLKDAAELPELRYRCITDGNLESTAAAATRLLVERHIASIPHADRAKYITNATEREWMDGVDSGEINGVSLLEYGKRKLDEDAKRFAEMQQRQQEEAARRYAYSLTEQGIAESRRQVDAMSNVSNRGMLDIVRCQFRTINASASLAPAMLAEFAEFVRSFIAEHFPDLDTPEVSPVALENARLRKENEQLRDRVASLERALGSKQSAGKMLAGAIAWSSGDLEKT